MKIVNIISFSLVALTTTSAFIQPTPKLGTNLGVSAGPSRFGEKSIGGSFWSKPATLSMSNNNDLDEIKEKADEVTKFLVVDVDQTRAQLANNWGWIVASGVFTMALGALAFLVPVTATGVAYNGTLYLIGATGLVGFFNAFARENGHKVKSALSGAAYMGLAYYMATNPGAGLSFITLSIAAAISAEGLFETALAIKNKNIEGRAWHAVSGIVSVIAGLGLTVSMPVSSLVTPGVALGARLSGNGATKVAVGLAGKEIANSRN